MEKIYKSKFYLLVISIIIFAFWFVCMLAQNGKIKTEYYLTIESIELTAIGAAAFIVLVTSNNLFYVIPWITYTPFVFSHPFTSTTMPYALFIAGGLLFIGIIVHLIKYKIKLTLGAFFLGLLLLGIAIVLGGINTGADFLKQQIPFTIVAAAGLIIIYIIFVSGTDVDFRMLCHLMNCLGLLLSLQVIASFYFLEDYFSFLINKIIDVGWGISNNIAIMLLISIPCSIYLAIKSTYLKTAFYTVVAYLQTVIVVLTYSRGAVAALAVGGSILLIVSIWLAFKNSLKTAIPYLLTILVLVGLSAFGLYLFLTSENEQVMVYADGFKENITKINLDSLNGRDPIYEHCMEEFKLNPIFGKGLYSPFFDNEFTGGYQWGHSTVIHTLYTMGSVGGVALGIHFIQKYLNLLIKPNTEKIIAVFSFAISGLYGLVDVSYYFINYMIVFIMYLICLQKTVKASFDLL